MTIYFLESVVNQNFLAIINFAVLTAVIAYPFILLGQKINNNFKKQTPLIGLFSTTAITFLIAWVCISIYNLLIGSSINFNIIGLIVGIIFVFLFVIIGDKLKKQIDSVYLIPEKLNLLIIGFIVSILAWIVIFGLFYLNFGVIS